MELTNRGIAHILGILLLLLLGNFTRNNNYLRSVPLE